MIEQGFGKSWSWSRVPWGTLGLGSLAIMLYVSPVLVEGLSLRRDALGEGAWWLLFTGHFTHWDNSHFLWDTVVFAVLGARCELVSRKAFWSVVIGGAFTISMVFLIGYSSLTSYRGLSGIDSGLFALALVFMWRRRCQMALWPKILLSLGFLSKMVVEIATDTPLFVESAGESFVAVPLAHVTGAIWGIAVGVLLGVTSQEKVKASHSSRLKPLLRQKSEPVNQSFTSNTRLERS